MTVVVTVLMGCAGPSLSDRPVRARVLAVETVASLPLDLVMPSDALLRDDGSVLVLDGYGGRVLTVDAGATAITAFATVGRASRLSDAADGGVWVTRPGTADEAGSLLHLDSQGTDLGVVVPLAADGGALHPVDVLDTDGRLVVADRTQGLVWLPDGAVHSTLRRVVDLAVLPSGFLGVDTLARQVVTLSPVGEGLAAFGRPGLSVGTFARPTSVAVVPGGLLVSDSVLGVVQAFDVDGALVGVLGGGSEPLRFGHPVAVRSNAGIPGLVAVLEAEPARLQLLRVPTLPVAELSPLLRTTLVEADADPAGEDGRSCATCHDGLVLDSRQLWDPARKHHPVYVVPERPIPAFFPLHDGKLACPTCHSPHGTVDEAGDDRAPLVRHAAADSGFTRLDAQSDALCVACHPSDAHGRATPGVVGGGHPAGAALAAALERRGDRDLTKARCLSCHVTHGAATDALLRATDEASACVGCHEPQQDPATNHPLGRVPGKDLVKATADGEVPLAADGGVGCLTCHDLTSSARALLRALPGGKPVCLECHTERGDLTHGAHRSLGRAGAPACVACHDLHGGEREASFFATSCLSCHPEGRVGHPVAPKLACLTCHDPHLADAPDCAECHVEQPAGGHGRAACLACHPAHRADPAWSGPENPASGRCLACHAASRATDGAPVVRHYDHPAPTFLPNGQRWTPLAGLTLYDPRGQPVAPGQNGDLTCQTCHVVHGHDGTADHLRRATGWQAACASCHGDDGLVFYRTFHSPERRAALTGGAP